MQGLQEFVDGLFSTFTDSTVYFCMGVLGTFLFGIKAVMLMVVGVDADIDIDVDADVDVGDTDLGFGLFSMMSIMAFLMGAGWLGLACRTEWGFGPLQAAGAAGGFGFALMALSSFGMYQMRKLTEVGKYDVQHCVGELGRVYLRIPAKGQGRGQVEVTVDGRQKILSAVSDGDALDSFTTVRVVDVLQGETVIVHQHE